MLGRVDQMIGPTKKRQCVSNGACGDRGGLVPTTTRQYGSRFVPRTICLSLSLALFGLVASLGPGHAQSSDPRYDSGVLRKSQGWEKSEQSGRQILDGVFDRARPDYAPIGLRRGVFTFYPSVSLRSSYDNNIFARRFTKRDDVITRLAPSLLVQGRIRNNDIALYGGVDGVFYRDFHDENRTDAHAGLRGRLAVGGDMQFRYYGNWHRSHEERGSSGASIASALSDDPTLINTYRAGLAVDRRFNRFAVSLGGSYKRTEYDDAVVGGVIVSQDFRNGDVYTGQLRASYDISPKTAVFSEFGYEWRDYELPTLNSVSLRAVAGLKADITHLLRGEIYAGYLQRRFDTPGVADIGTPHFGGTINWFVTPLVTLTLLGERNIQETTFLRVGSYVESMAGVRVDYELLRNLILSGRASYQWDDYQDAPRDDHYTRFGLSATLLVSRHTHLSLDYRFTQRESNLSLFDYTRSMMGFTARLQY